MEGIVLELQRDALNPKFDVASLARKALVVSKKLGISQIEEWINKELNGYSDNEDLPTYRRVYGEIKVENPYHGWQPLVWEDPREAEKLFKIEVRFPLGELDSYVSNDTNGAIKSPLHPELAKELIDSMQIPLTPALFVSISEIVGLLDAVKNIILNWALELEKEGIIGEGMSFSVQEKQKAENVNRQVINYFGNMHHSQLMLDSPGAVQTISIHQDIDKIVELIGQIRSSISELKLSESNQRQLLADIHTIESQSQSPTPKQSIIMECLHTIRNILEGAAGNVMASGFITELAKYLS